VHFFAQYLLFTSSGACYSSWLIARHWSIAQSYFASASASGGRLPLFCFIWIIYAELLFLLSGLITLIRLCKLAVNAHHGVTAYEALLLLPPPPTITTSGKARRHSACTAVARAARCGCDRAARSDARDAGEVVEADRSRVAEELRAILAAERGGSRGLGLLLGRRRWWLALLLPLPAEPAHELLDTIAAWEAAVAASQAV
jgi:hypothetical protein